MRQKSSQLNVKQLRAIDYLVQGKTQAQTADILQLTKECINRWVNHHPLFKEELEKRMKQGIQRRQEIVDEAFKEEVVALSDEVAEYRDMRRRVYQTQTARALKMLIKIGERFDELQKREFSPKDLPAYFSVANKMAEDGLDGWAALLGLNDRKIRELSAVQDLADSGFIPVHKKQEIETAYDEFHEKVLRSLNTIKSAEAELTL